MSLFNLKPLSIMKTRKIFAAALALPILFACTKVEIVPTEQPAEGDKGFDISVVVNSDNETKAVFDDAEGILWVNPGSAGLVTSTSTTEAAKKSSAATVSEGGRKSAFTFTGITAGTYRLFYPYCETYYPNIKFTVPANQTQDAGGKSSDIFAGMATEDITATEGENSVDVKYRAVGSYIQFLVYGKAGEKVRFISVVSSDSKIAGDYLVNATDFTHSVLEGGSERVLVALGESGYTTPANVDGASGIYAAVLPGYSKNTYYVTTDKATYAFASSEAKNFEAGYIKTVKLNLENGKAVQNAVPEELYIVGNVTYVGWTPANAIKMTKEGNVFSTDVYLSTQWKNSSNVVEKAEGFKFLTQNQNFDTGYVKGIDGKLTYYSGTNVEDSKFTVDKAGYYHVVANFDTGEVTCTPKAPEKLYVWGAATEASWDSSKAIELTKSAENEFVFTAQLYLNGNEEFKFFSENNEYTAYVNDGSGNLIFFDSPSGSDADKKFNENAFGLYNLTVNLSEGTVKAESGDLYLLGDCFGWDVTYGKPMKKVSEGVYEISKLRFPTSDVSNKFKFAFKKGDAIEFAFSVVPDNYDKDGNIKEYGISFATEWNETQNPWSSKKEKLSNESNVKIIANFDNDAFGFGKGDNKWYIDTYYCNKFYDFKLDLNTKKLTATLSQGSDFWLIGINNTWSRSDDYKATAGEDGIAKWTSVAVDKSTDGWDGTFKICGENVLPDDFWSGEWYHSNIPWDKDGARYEWKEGSYGNPANVVFEKTSDRKWYMSESGTYDFEFDTKNLTLKVTKK